MKLDLLFLSNSKAFYKPCLSRAPNFVLGRQCNAAGLVWGPPESAEPSSCAGGLPGSGGDLPGTYLARPADTVQFC